MVNFDFDLESAEIELLHVSNLLSVFDEFFQNEVPAMDDQEGSIHFVRRVGNYYSLIEAAHDKIDSMRSEMEASINSYYAEAKKRKAV